MSTLKEAIKNTPIGKLMRPGVRALRRRWGSLHWRFERQLAAEQGARPLEVLERSPSPELRELAGEGMVQLRGVYSSTVADALRPGLRDLLERVKAGERQPDWDVVAYPRDGIYRLRRLDETFPAARPMLKHPRVLELVNAYIGPRWRYTAYADYKPDLVHDYTTVPHCDTWRRQIKAFTLVADVGPDNAPMVYWARSHRDGEWRRRMDYLLWSNDYIGSAGVFPPHILHDRVASGDLREVEVTGCAGDIIVVDTRGPHRASNLRAGFRLQLVEVFDPE
jgi:hypothetical protein